MILILGISPIFFLKNYRTLAITIEFDEIEVAAQDWRPGGAAEPSTSEAHGGGCGGLSEGVGGSYVTGPGFLFQRNKGGCCFDSRSFSCDNRIKV